MVKAIVKNGVIVPRDPLPEDWQEGTAVEVERAPAEITSENGVHPTDAWMDEVEAIAAHGDPQDDLRLEAAIQEIRRRGKELAPRDNLDRWFAELEAIAAQGDPEDDRRLDEAIRVVRQRRGEP